MTYLGERLRVGTVTNRAGAYIHTGCDHTAIFEEGTVFTSCSNRLCFNRDGAWISTDQHPAPSSELVLAQAMWDAKQMMLFAKDGRSNGEKIDA